MHANKDWKGSDIKVWKGSNIKAMISVFSEQLHSLTYYVSDSSFLCIS